MFTLQSELSLVDEFQTRVRGVKRVGAGPGPQTGSFEETYPRYVEVYTQVKDFLAKTSECESSSPR